MEKTRYFLFTTIKNTLCSFLFFLIILFSFCFITSSALQLGDIDNDNKISAKDARTALRISAKLDTPTELQLKLADVNRDTKVTASDARIILRVSAKLQKFEFTLENESTTQKTETPTERPTENPTTETTQHTHNYIIKQTIEGTCSDNGKIIYKCTSCDSEYSKNTPKTYHSTPYGTCEYCSIEINAIQLIIDKEKYLNAYNKIELDYNSAIQQTETTMKINMKIAGVSKLQSEEYYIQQLYSLNSEITDLNNKLLDTSISSDRRNLYEKQLHEKQQQLVNFELLLEAAKLSDKINTLESKKIEELTKLTNEYNENKSEAVKNKCMLCLTELTDISKDGFCDECRKTIDKKTLLIAEENTCYYNAQIELFKEYFKTLDTLQNPENIIDFSVLGILGIYNLEDLIEYYNSHPQMIKQVISILGITEEEFKDILNISNNPEEFLKEKLEADLARLKSEHEEILKDINNS